MQDNMNKIKAIKIIAGLEKQKAVKKRITAVSMIFVIYCLFTGNVTADFNYTGIGARPVALGNCYTAFSDDAFGVYYNPGGLCFARYPEISTQFGQLWMNLTDNSNLTDGYLGGVYPVEKAAYGFAVQKFSLDGYYSENTMSFAYSRKISDSLGLGVTFRQMQQAYTMDEYTLTDEVFNNGNTVSKAAFGIDPGLLWAFYPDYFFGMSIINLNQPDFGLVEKEMLPVTFNFGLSYRSNYPLGDISLGLGLSQTDKDYKITSGIEKLLMKGKLAARLGYGFGSSQYSGISVGIGLKIVQATFDYSLNFPVSGMKQTGGTQRISLTYRFARLSEEEMEGQQNFKAEKAQLIKKYEGQVKELENKISELDAKFAESQRMPAAQQTPRDIENSRKIEKQILEMQGKLKNQKIQKEQELQAPVPQKVIYDEPLQEVIPKVQPQTPKEPAAKTHTVKEGESLLSIAQKYYNDSSKWKIIYEANKSKIERGQVLPGQVLKIP